MVEKAEKIQQLQDSLNAVVTEPNEIDAVFVFDIENGFKTKMPERTFTKKPKLPQLPSFLGKLRKIKNINGEVFCDENLELSKSFFNQLKEISNLLTKDKKEIEPKYQYTTFHFDKGTMVCYFFDDGVLSFVNATSEGAGLTVWHSRKHFDSIKKHLKKLNQ